MWYVESTEQLCVLARRPDRWHAEKPYLQQPPTSNSEEEDGVDRTIEVSRTTTVRFTAFIPIAVASNVNKAAFSQQTDVG